MEEKSMNKFVKFLKTVFVDNIIITVLSLVLAVGLCILTAAMAL